MNLFMMFLLGVAFSVLVYFGVNHAFSFKAQKPADYAGGVPGFDIREILSGEMITEGVIFGLSGRVNSRFVATMNAQWDGPSGTMTEHFSYSSGRKQKRSWSFTMLGEDGRFTATAPDIIGVAHGQQMGHSVRLTYRISLPEDAGGHVLDVVDWMYLLDNGSVMNRSEFRKFGIKVAELVATFRPIN